MTSRRSVLGGSAAVAAAAVTAAACSSSHSSPGSAVNADAGSVNDLQAQQEKLTITPYNAVKTIPDQAYPATLLRTSLELRNQRERLLRFNNPNKLGWAHLFTASGALVLVLPVMGKVSSTQSSMTASTGIYKSANGYQSSGGGNVPVQLPGDDLSFGPNEGGDSGKFFFTPDGVYVFWDGPILYLDAPLKVNQTVLPLEYTKGSSPSTTAPKA